MFFLSDIMKFFIVFALAFATVWAKDLYSRSIEIPVIEKEGRIVNGKYASPGQFYYQVGLNFKKKGEEYNWCGGSFIGETWVLTASQCIYDTELANVYMGGTVRSFAEKYHTVWRKNMILYPGWNFRDRIADIGLMRIPNTSETGTMGKIRLPRNNDNQYLGAKVVMAGWGHTSDTSTILSIDLQYVELEVSPAINCYRAFDANFYASRDICVDTPKLESPCLNNYGGPLVLEGQRIQIGVFSLGSEKGCGKGHPTIFTRVSSYLDWIDYHTGIKY